MMIIKFVGTMQLVFYILACRCPYLVVTYSIGIAVYQGIIALFVITNFGLATFMDPGIYPKGGVFAVNIFLCCLHVIISW